MMNATTQTQQKHKGTTPTEAGTQINTDKQT